MSSELAERIRASFATHDPADAVDNVKTAVADYLRRTDPAVTVHRTDYFNHTFAPDFVLAWPRDNIARYVYLRTNSDPIWLKDDLENIGDRHPLMMTLSATEHNGPMQEVAASARQRDTLITEPGTLEALTLAKNDRREAAGLLGSALLQGGRGVMSEATVGSAVETTADGFEAAESVSQEPTRRAAVLLKEILDDRQSDRLTRVLRWVWEGHGGAPSDFPGATDIAAQVTGADLRYILDSAESDDEVFWRRIGRNLTLELLTRIPGNNMPTSFQHLVNANASILIAKAVRVARTDAVMGDQDIVFEWFLSKGNLALRGSNFTAYIAATTVESLPPVPRRDGPTIPTLRRRAQAAGLNIGGVRVTTQRAAITYESVSEADLVTDEDFANVSGALGSATRVAEATVMVNGKRLICDFEESTAKGYTNATFPVSELVRVSIPLMQPVDEAAYERLTELATNKRIGPDGSEQLDLWE